MTPSMTRSLLSHPSIDTLLIKIVWLCDSAASAPAGRVRRREEDGWTVNGSDM